MKQSTFESKFMTCNNRRLELLVEVISSILHLSAQSRLQFPNTKAFTSVSRGRCVAGHQHQSLSPHPRAACHGLLSLRRDCQATVQGNKISALKLLPLKSNTNGLSFWKSLLWIHLSFFFSDCKDKGVLFLIGTKTVEASWFTIHGGWARVTVRGKPFPAQGSIIQAKVDPCHIGDFCSLSPTASLWTLLNNHSPSLTLWLPSGHTQSRASCASPTFFAVSSMGIPLC